MGKEQEIEWAGAVSLRTGLVGGALWLRVCFVNPLEVASPAPAVSSLAFLGYLDVPWGFSTSLNSSSKAEKGKSIQQC